VSARLVLDASAALEAVLGRAGAGLVLDALEQADVVTVPDLFFAEVANALWKYVSAGELEPGEADGLLREAMALPDATVPAQELAPEALATAGAYGHPVYDALYAIAARRDGATVLTLDRRLASLLGEMRVPCMTA